MTSWTNIALLSILVAGGMQLRLHFPLSLEILSNGVPKFDLPLPSSNIM
jgi:hypothetical protein